MMDIFEAGGCTVVPLFDGRKFPRYEGYRGERPLAAAAAWLSARQEMGMRPVLSGRYALLTGWGVVVDCEGKAWQPNTNAIAAGHDIPQWMQAILGAARAGALLSWISAGGDGGRDIRNVLLPYSYVDICTAIGVPVAVAPGGAVGAKAGGTVHRVKLGEEGIAELLLKYGVCIPRSEIWHRAGGVEDGPVQHISEVRWCKESQWIKSVDNASDIVKAAQALARPVMSYVTQILGGAVTAAREAGREIGAGDGFGEGEMPINKFVERALIMNGPAVALEVTREELARGGSRHYIAKAWAFWALTVRGDVVLASASGDHEESLRRLAEQLWMDWARDADFPLESCLKSVREEAKHLGWGRGR